MKATLYLTLVSSLLFLSSTSSEAATILDGTTAIIDFGWDLSESSPIYGNRIGGASTNQTLTSLFALDGLATDWSLQVVGFRGVGASATTFGTTLWNTQAGKFNDFSSSLGLSTPMSELAWRDCALLGNTAAGTSFALTNLEANKEYTISFGLGRLSGSGATNISLAQGTLESASWFNSAGGTGATALTSLTFNSNQTIATYKVVADNAGQISFNFSNASYGAVNFMTVTVPEPSTASLGLLGLTGLLLRRRRG